MAMGIKRLFTLKLLFTLSLFLVHCKGNDPQSRKFRTSQQGGINNVFVYKYDGSLQCGRGQAIPLNKMKEQLKGIEVFSGLNKSDGLMRAQACGINTGRANVYEISRKDLMKAKELDFKLWTFN